MDLRETGLQARHPWETARWQFFGGVLRRHGLLSHTRAVIDGGAGDAWFSSQLIKHLPGDAQIHCWDSEYTPEIMGDLQAMLSERIHLSPQRPEGQFDLLTLLDVLEHVPDDRAFLGDVVSQNLAPGGYALISVPAWQPLYTNHDRFLQHCRRYSPDQGLAVLQSAGLQVLEHGGLFHTLMLPRALEKAREFLIPPRGTHKPGIHWRGGKLLTQGVQSLLEADNALTHWAARTGIALPGLSWYALARKPLLTQARIP